MTQKKDTIWNATFIAVFIANCFQNLGQHMMNSLVPKYANSLGAASWLVGFVSSMFAVTALAIRPFSSPASDSFSKKKLLVFAELLFMVAMFGYSISNSVGMVIAFRLLHGIGSGIAAPLCLALASNSLPEDKMGSGIGIFSVGQAISQAIGPTAGLSLQAALGYKPTFAIGGAIMVLAIILAIRIPENPLEERQPFKISLDRIVAKQAVLPGLFMTIVSTSYATWSAFIAIYGEALGVKQVGLYFTAYAIALLALRPLAGKLSDKLGFEKVLIPALFVFALNLVALSQARSLAGFILAGVLGAAGYGLCQPLCQSLSMQSVRRNQRGAAGNTNYMFQDFGMLAGPIIGGAFVDSMVAKGIQQVDAYSHMYLLMLTPLVIGLVYIILVKNKIKKNVAEAAAANARPAA